MLKAEGNHFHLGVSFLSWKLQGRPKPFGGAWAPCKGRTFSCCGWTKSISHHFETVGNRCLLVFTGESVVQNGCRPSTVSPADFGLGSHQQGKSARRPRHQVRIPRSLGPSAWLAREDHTGSSAIVVAAEVGRAEVVPALLRRGSLGRGSLGSENLRPYGCVAF